MTFRMRTVLVGLAAASSLALSSSALAGFGSPRLFAGQPEQSNRVNLLYTQSTADDALAKLVHYVPLPYRTNLDARPAGTLVGSAVLRGNPIDRIGDNAANSNLVLAGTVEAVRADTVIKRNGRDLRMSQAATQCTGKPLGERAQYWVVRLKDAGADLTWDLPVFAERLSGQTTFGADATVTVCFGAPDVAPTNANRAPGGFRVRQFDLRLTRVFTAPKDGEQRWSTLATPYVPRTARVNTDGTVELQSILTYPRAVSLGPLVRAKLTQGFATYRFSGRVSTPPHDRPRVSLFRGFNKAQVGSRTAQAYAIRTGSGTYSKLHTIRRVPKTQTFWFQVRAYAPTAIYGRDGCQTNWHPEVTCIQTTRTGYMVRSRSVMVRVPAR